MGILSGWSRSKLAWRIAGRVVDLDLSYDTRTQAEIQKSLLDSYGLSMLARIDEYQQHNSSYQPHLTGTIVRAPRRSIKNDSAEFCLTVIETLTTFLKEVEVEYCDPASPNYKTAMESAEEILDSMLNFVLFDEGSEFSGGTGTKISQHKNLLAASFLLAQSDYPEIFTPHVLRPSSDKTLPTHYDEWMTLRVLSEEADLPSLVAEYLERAERREIIGKKLSLRPDTIRDNMCDYSDEVIDLIVEARKQSENRDPRHDMYEVVMNSLIDCGATEAAVREVIYFASQIDLRAYAASKFITVLHDYPQLEQYEDYSLAPQHVRDQCMALMTVAIEIWGSGSRPLKDSETNGFKLTNDELIRFIIEEPHLAPRIADAITDRESADIEMLRTATSSVMSDGAL